MQGSEDSLESVGLEILVISAKVCEHLGAYIKAWWGSETRTEKWNPKIMKEGQ